MSSSPASPAPIGVVVEDQPMRIRAELYAGDTLIAVDTMSYTPRCPTGEQADFCHDNCNGLGP